MSLSEYMKGLKDTEKEQVYTMFSGFENTSEETLVDIICSSSDKNTIDKAMQHKNFSSHGWKKLLPKKNFVGITAQELLNKAYEIIQKIEDEKECSDILYGIVSSPITTFEMLENILKFINKKTEEDVSKAKEEISRWREWTDNENKFFRIEFFRTYKQFAYILLLIAVHPNCNFDLSNKVFEILGEIDKMKLVEKYGIKRTERNFWAFTTFFDEKFDKEKLSKWHEMIYPDTTLSEFNNLPCMANGVILEFLERCKLFQEENKEYTLISDNEKKVFLDFVFDDKTTDELIKKVLLDRFDNFFVSKEGTNERVLDSRFVSLLGNIVSDERFKEQNMPIELLRKIFANVDNVNIAKICLSKDTIIEIAKTTNNPAFLLQILAFSVYSNECVEIIWNRRNEFKENIDKIYAGILMCASSTKEMLLEALNNYSATPPSWYCYRAVWTILNQNFDKELYETLISKLGQNGFSSKLDNKSISKIEITDFSTIEQWSEDDSFDIADKNAEVIKCVESCDDINPNAVENYIQYHLGEKYLGVYYKLKSFRNQRQTLEQEGKGVTK